MTNDELRAAIAALDTEIAAAEEAAKPARAALRPFDEVIWAIEDRRETLLDEHEKAVAGKCETCGKVLLVGERGFPAGEDHGPYCEDDAPTLGDLLKNNEEALAAGADDDEGEIAESIAHLRARIDAGESPDTKCLYTL